MKIRRESFCGHSLVSACTALNYTFTICKHTYKTIKHASKTRKKQWASKNSTAFKKHSYPDCHTLSIGGLNIPPHACEGGNTRASSPSSREPRAFLCARYNSIIMFLCTYHKGKDEVR